MILELDDGRELNLPDEMDEETARQLGKMILALEKRAQEAEDRARSLEVQFAQLKNEVRAPAVESSDDEAVIAAINAMRREIAAGLAKSAALAAADRVIVYDSLGAPRSRIVMNKGG